MEKIIGQEFIGERPLYCRHGLYLENVKIHRGESALKETSDITAVNCVFEGKYPFWCCENFIVKNCLFTGGARAALWYSKNLEMTDTYVDAPKMFREMDGIKLKKRADSGGCGNSVALQEHLAGQCKRRPCRLYFHALQRHKKSVISAWTATTRSKYCKNVEIHDSILNTKDAFWNTENVTVYDSEINGEYLGWYAKNLRLVRCRISGSQPLCYAENLIMEDCTMAPDADLAFEYSSVNADVKGHITSVKNPRTGHIKADSIGEIIIDENIKKPGDCKICSTSTK